MNKHFSIDTSKDGLKIDTSESIGRQGNRLVFHIESGMVAIDFIGKDFIPEAIANKSSDGDWSPVIDRHISRESVISAVNTYRAQGVLLLE